MDAGWPNWSIDSDRVAVILGNAIGGEKHYKSSMRIQLPEALKRLAESATLRSLSPEAQHAIIEETRAGYLDNMFEITEDTMPGELSNVIAGRIANVLNLRGPNYTTDAACASGLAALNSAILGLNDHQYDAVITGGVDRNMGVDAFVKFCKIGALSATGTRPFDAGADGFVMGEGAALFVRKRLADSERDGDNDAGAHGNADNDRSEHDGDNDTGVHGNVSADGNIAYSDSEAGHCNRRPRCLPKTHRRRLPAGQPTWRILPVVPRYAYGGQGRFR